MSDQDSLQVTICSSFVAKPLQDYIFYWSKEFDMNIKVSFAPYNQVFQQLLDPYSVLNQNKGINVLFIRVEDWLRDKKDESPSHQKYFLDQTYLEFIEAVNKARSNTNVPFLIGIVPHSSAKSYSSEVADCIISINLKLDSLLKGLPWFYLFDLIKIATLYDVEEVFDSKSDEIAHIPFIPEYYAALGTFLTRRIHAYKGTHHKVIAFECDNTIWKGACGKEGNGSIIIDKNFTYLQEFLLEKYNEGFLLVLCSKNNESDVWKVFDHHPQMKLRREHFATYRINCDPIVDSLMNISTELNLGLDNFIFLDSNFGTEEVSVSCPEIFSVTLPEDPDTFFSFFNHIWEFDIFQSTEEDRQRNKMYKAEKVRTEEQANFEDINDFLQSLNLQINLHSVQEKDLDRALQLILRTNQFNLNGIRKTREEVLKAIHENHSVNWIIDVKDRFGDYGMVGLILAREIKNTLVIYTFVLSCRALGKNVEDFMFSQLKKYCINKGLRIISAHFTPTPKNQPFLKFLKQTEWEADDLTNTYNFMITDKSKTMLVKK